MMFNKTGKDSLLQGLVDSYNDIANLEFVKDKLQESTLFKGNYQFGRKKNITLEHNLADDLRNRLVEKLYFNRYEEAKPQVGLGFQFGKDDRWKGKLTGSEGDIGFKLGATF